jgi:hypothetical protein
MADKVVSGAKGEWRISGLWFVAVAEFVLGKGELE